jgi:pSer/pThr/pTyr-binding forkhead associated (FHA) protein
VSRFRLAQGKSPPNDKGGAGPARGARASGGDRAHGVDDSSDEGDGFFVDAAPSQVVERPTVDARRGRAADRRRERGRAPEPVAPKDTRTAMARPDEGRGTERALERALDRPSERDLPRRPTGQYARPAAGEKDSSAIAAAPTGIVASGRVDGLRATLTCLKGPENGQVLQLTTGTYTIGRARENEFVLKDIAASRKHLQIDVDGAGARMTDLGSGNGTKVNGKRTASVALRHGDTIEIGSSLLVFAAAGRDTPVDDASREEAQARVVAAADELARELHDKLRFGDGDAGGPDGYVAKTAALRTADVRAGADELARERERKAADDARGGKKSRKLNEREWNETFTNMPLSAVVPGEQPLQGTAANRADPRADVRGARAKAGALAVAEPLPARPRGPVGTAAAFAPDDSIDDGPALEASMSTTRASPLVSALLSAFAVLLVGALALALGFGAWALLREPAKPTTAGVDAADVVAREREADFQRAIEGMQQSYAQGDWAKASAYAGTALQLHPDDAMARRYQHDADDKLKAALAAVATTSPAGAPLPGNPSTTTNGAADPASTTTPPTTTTTTTTTTEPAKLGAATTPPDAAVAAPTSTRPEVKPVATAPETKAPEATTPKTPPKAKKPVQKPSSPPTRRTMSEEEAATQFDRAIRALQSKDTEAACKILESIIDRGPRGSRWQDKADSLFSRRCGN